MVPQAPASRDAPSAGLPHRRKGEYTRWNLGQAAPPPVVPSPSAAPPGPDPVEVAFEQARAQGFAEGVKRSTEQVEAKYRKRLGDLEASLQELTALRSVLGEVYRRELVEVALAAAEALVQRELSRGRDVLESMIDKALSELGTEDSFVLSLAETDASRLTEWAQTQPRIALRVDGKRQPGDFRLEGGAGSVESLMHERIDRVRQLVLGELAAEPSA